jgi:hypothetical protein
MCISAAAVLGAIGLAVLAAGCGGGSGASAAGPASTTTGTTTTTPGGGGPNAAAFQAYRDCLSAHGVTLPARPGGGQGGTPPAGQPPASTPGAPGAGGGPQGRFGNLTAKQQAAITACQSKRPAGARGFGGGGANGSQANPAFAKYTACLKSHGVTFGSTSPSSSTFTKATAACKSLLPASTGGSANGGTTTTP